MLNNRFKFSLILILFLCLNSVACTHAENKIIPIKSQSLSITQPISSTTKKNKLDYYVLALSWSPEYCKTHHQLGMQCKRQVQQAYHFVLHGLWPSIDKTCTQEKLSDAVIADALSVIPSKKLIEHEWQKHGRCSGFDPKQFFDLSKQAFTEIKIPDFFDHIDTKTTKKVKEIKTLFLLKNSNLKTDSVRVININKELSEIRVCLDKSLQTISCPFPANSNPETEIAITPPAA